MDYGIVRRNGRIDGLLPSGGNQVIVDRTSHPADWLLSLDALFSVTARRWHLWTSITLALGCLHLVQALFIAFHASPATQDGPVHLYAGEILSSLLRDPESPFAGYFESNLRPFSNSLFSYVAVWLEAYTSVTRTAQIFVFVSLVGLPLAALAFEQVLRTEAQVNHRSDIPRRSATLLACIVAHNYFLYRGLFNYAVSIPFAFATVAAVMSSGHPGIARAGLVVRNLLAIGFSLLAALAHPAAIGFLLLAIPFASIRGPRVRQLSAVFALLPVLWVARNSQVDDGLASSTSRWVDPGTAISQFVRAIGISFSWLEAISAVGVLVLVLVGVAKALRGMGPFSPRDWWRIWSVRWPLVMAMAMAAAFFVVPFEYGGVAGLNERIPLYAILLVLPYVSLSSLMCRVLPFAVLVLGGYFCVERALIDQRVERSSVSTAAEMIPKGSVIYGVSLQVKLGTVSVDLGRHLLADLARKRELISGAVACSHPNHVLKCRVGTPAMPDVSAIQAFEHLTAAERELALRDSSSAIRRSLEAMRESARRAEFLVVLGSELLDAEFERHVVAPLDAKLLGPEGDPVRVYRLAHHAS